MSQCYSGERCGPWASCLYRSLDCPWCRFLLQVIPFTWFLKMGLAEDDRRCLLLLDTWSRLWCVQGSDLYSLQGLWDWRLLVIVHLSLKNRWHFVLFISPFISSSFASCTCTLYIEVHVAIYKDFFFQTWVWNTLTCITSGLNDFWNRPRFDMPQFAFKKS
jgi:hypothetical protein